MQIIFKSVCLFVRVRVHVVCVCVCVLCMCLPSHKQWSTPHGHVHQVLEDVPTVVDYFMGCGHVHQVLEYVPIVVDYWAH